MSPNGNDAGKGTEQDPLKTLNVALQQARNLRRLDDSCIRNGIHIYLKGGVYPLYEPIRIYPEDAGTAKSPTVIEAASNEKPVISGGVKILNWRKLTAYNKDLPKEAKGKVWIADLPHVYNNHFSFRQLWVNGQKAIRAQSEPEGSMSRILSWNHKTETCWIPLSKTPNLKYARGMELFIHQSWAIAILRIKNLEVQGDSAKLSFFQPESSIESIHPWPAPWISKETGNSPFYLDNALQFLKEPGEWYLDEESQKLYYWPKPGADMLTASVIAPFTETLVHLEGTIDHPVSHIFFKGISFEHTGWLRPSQSGHIPHQEGLYMLEAYKLAKPGTKEKKSLENQAWVGRPAAAFFMAYADEIHIDQCRFQHMASTGLDLYKAVHHASVTGNLFEDIGGNGISAGLFSDESSEIHLPYLPKDEREITGYLKIENNLISNITNEDWGCVGIGAGYVRNTVIQHNELSALSYSAISVGWGWTPIENALRDNLIYANHIHHYGMHNYDCSGIYTLSAQSGTVISNNYIDSICKAPYAHLPSHWFYLYTDEGSAFMTIKNNWTPSQKFLQNANGPGNQWINNGPQVDAAVKQYAGLETPYQFLLNGNRTDFSQTQINQEHKEVIELVAKEGITTDLHRLKQVLSNVKLDTTSIYQWEKHIVIFETVQDLSVLSGKLKNALPDMSVKVYYDLFYQVTINDSLQGIHSKAYQTICLAALLADDKKLQQQFVDAIAFAFHKTPSLKNQLQNAGLHQVQFFRSGTHIIVMAFMAKNQQPDTFIKKLKAVQPDIKGKGLNQEKYQQEMPGALPGQFWVPLKPLNN